MSFQRDEAVAYAQLQQKMKQVDSVAYVLCPLLDPESDPIVRILCKFSKRLFAIALDHIPDTVETMNTAVTVLTSSEQKGQAKAINDASVASAVTMLQNVRLILPKCLNFHAFCQQLVLKKKNYVTAQLPIKFIELRMMHQESFENGVERALNSRMDP